MIDVTQRNFNCLWFPTLCKMSFYCRKYSYYIELPAIKKTIFLMNQPRASIQVYCHDI